MITKSPKNTRTQRKIRFFHTKRTENNHLASATRHSDTVKVDVL
ncbi:hypothetical protein BRYFOR_09063 [Marvinbryantia formatexigens DSM 14469]|uniref:Uncharacterized protein n=1 Tax=Marvinbryantia formatexigens DSM 14469 TaxID=478749 RepID=C6LK76_9FIRM|nr:hypothetical protein BRYFOR_09063 [Marvinbryantia formatexigens DSM 14469]